VLGDTEYTCAGTLPSVLQRGLLPCRKVVLASGSGPHRAHGFLGKLQLGPLGHILQFSKLFAINRSRGIQTIHRSRWIQKEIWKEGED
jgi:hypothetical protein